MIQTFLLASCTLAIVLYLQWLFPVGGHRRGRKQPPRRAARHR